LVRKNSHILRLGSAFLLHNLGLIVERAKRERWKTGEFCKKTLKLDSLFFFDGFGSGMVVSPQIKRV
jgi:hypothetical protein